MSDCVKKLHVINLISNLVDCRGCAGRDYIKERLITEVCRLPAIDNNELKAYKDTGFTPAGVRELQRLAKDRSLGMLELQKKLDRTLYMLSKFLPSIGVLKCASVGVSYKELEALVEEYRRSLND